MDLKETYNRIAEDWVKDHSQDDWWVAGTDTFIAALPLGSLVLDMGCGGGVKSQYLKEHGLQVIGADFSENMIALAQKRVPGVAFRVVDMREVHTLPEIFDGIFAQASLLHIPRVEAARVVSGFAQKVRPGGLVYLAVKGKREDGAEEAVVKENDYGYAYERFFSYFTLEEIRSYLTDSGLTVMYESVSPVGRTKWIQVIGQKTRQGGHL